jgi:thioredoxin 1
MHRVLTLSAIVILLTGCQSTATKVDDEDSSPLAAAKPVTASGFTEITKTSDASFAQDVLNAKSPVLVDFNTSWCVPSKQMDKGKMKFYSIDAEKNPIAAQKFSITAYPTFLIFMNGKSESQIVGAKTKLQMEGLITEARVFQ